MTDRDKCVLALRVLGSTDREVLVDRLSADEIEVLRIQQPEKTGAVLELFMSNNDFAWRGAVTGGPQHGALVNVRPTEVREGAVHLIAGVLEKLGAFRPRKVAAPKKRGGKKR